MFGPSLEFKTCMTIKSYVFTVLSLFEFLYKIISLSSIHLVVEAVSYSK